MYMFNSGERTRLYCLKIKSVPFSQNKLYAAKKNTGYMYPMCINLYALFINLTMFRKIIETIARNRFLILLVASISLFREYKIFM